MQDGIPGGRVTIDIADAVAEVALNLPDRLNALGPLMFEALAAAGERLNRTAGVRAVVLTGAGRGFSTGLDKETFAKIGARGRSRAHFAHLPSPLQGGHRRNAARLSAASQDGGRGAHA